MDDLQFIRAALNVFVLIASVAVALRVYKTYRETKEIQRETEEILREIQENMRKSSATGPKEVM